MNMLYLFLFYMLFASDAASATEAWTQTLAFTDTSASVQAVHVASDYAAGRVYVVTEEGTLYRTTDGGMTWIALEAKMHPSGATLSVALDPYDSRIVYRTAAKGVYKSIDAGTTWRRIDEGFEYGPSGAIAVSDATNTTLYAAVSRWCDSLSSCAGGGIMKSMDSGTTWRSAGLEGFGVRDIVLDPEIPDLMYAIVTRGDGSNVYRSTDAARSWTAIFPRSVRVSDWRIHPRDSQVIYMTAQVRFFVLLYRSTNGGRTWTLLRPVIDGFQPHPCPPDTLDCVGEPMVTHILLDPRHPGVLYGSDWRGVVRSTDGGSHWRYLAEGQPESTSLAAMRFDRGTIVASGRSRLPGAAGLYEYTTIPADHLYAFFAASAEPVSVGSDVQFADRSFGRVESWKWDFGDGSSSDERHPSHAYTRAGTFEVTLTVTDGVTSHQTSRRVEVFDHRRRRAVRR